MSDKQEFKCTKCGHGKFKKTWDRLYMCRKCHVLYIPRTMQVLNVGPSSYSVPAPLPDNKLSVRVDEYTDDGIARG